MVLQKTSLTSLKCFGRRIYSHESLIEMSEITIGVLALQGAFREHIAMLQQLPGVRAFEIRNTDDLALPMDGLVLPGGPYSRICPIM